ncbi:UvrD-helicase domain-containing protein [Sphaerisporangium sp. B11E5]|uniref:UvrD-helicase domain-containing protein n=1 Tax=Sphaerisporangium sp. B11E5 TaxID=3153563 RepID=UPI00325D1F97
MTAATLRLLDKADQEVGKLDRSVKGAVYEFQHKFRKNPHSHGLNLTQLKDGSRLYSAWVTADYRALLLHVGDADYLLLSVLHSKDIDDKLDRLAYQINPVTGGIEFVDVQRIEDTVLRPAKAPGLFDAYTAEQLLDLGVAEPLLPLIAKITTVGELRGLAASAPQLTVDILFGLHDGKSLDEVREQITGPVKADDHIDADDFATAATRPATLVTTDDAALQAVLGESFERWTVFLHPTQKKVVERRYNGPARVSGGPGTGKTIVALHRVKHLIDRIGPGHSKPVLLTTFNRNLAADLKTRLLELGGQELVDRVDIVNIDKLAHELMAQASGQGKNRRLISDEQTVREWRQLLLELGETGWDPEFLAAEWSHVILGQAVNSRAEYFQVRRAGRGRSISRPERAKIWQLAERFTKHLDDKGLWTWRQVAEHAARLEMERAARVRRYENDKARVGGQELIHRAAESGAWLDYRYKHVVVDEAQDLNAAHWKMLRAMVRPGPDDIFLVGDAHQRIYDNYVSLGSLGINIRGGRSSRLTLSYRSTHEILDSAQDLLTGETYDDMDDGTDHLTGYRSVLRGPHPDFRGLRTWDEERNAIADQIAQWNDVPPSAIAVCVPTGDMVTEVAYRLAEKGIPAVEIGPDGPRGPDGVRVGTMHRFKGLEFQRMIIAGVSDGLVPRRAIKAYRDADPLRYKRERQRDRSLLFVASTRARDSLAIFWHGMPSPFLPVP